MLTSSDQTACISLPPVGTKYDYINNQQLHQQLQKDIWAFRWPNDSRRICRIFKLSSFGQVASFSLLFQHSDDAVSPLMDDSQQKELLDRATT